MRVKWWVEDGYRKGRTRYINIPDEDLEGLDDTERDMVICDYVSWEFVSQISFSYEIEKDML
jgi:hypothetical protein